ncbi:MAG TPA: hypothetical protein VLW26_03760 [Steroidobacteraceae bacterium]|nr:hypothetical protein [Steroidobacteraceae bacterium]
MAGSERAGATPESTIREKAHLDGLLDEALEDTFPASDPIAVHVEPRPADRTPPSKDR